MSTTAHELKSVYIISPHQDDAAFSLALTIAHLAKNRAPVTIVNCFTLSEYQPLGSSPSVAEVSDVRHQEDLKFISQIPGLSVRDLGFLDAPLRLGISPENVCLDREKPPSIPLDPAAGKLKHSFLNLPAPHLAFVPLAIGGHVDHRLARDEALAAFSSKHIVFYQDLPYIDRFVDSDLEVAGVLSSLGVRCVPFTLVANDSREDKLNYIAAYNSQASETELKAIANSPNGERLWLKPETLPFLLALHQSVARSL